MGFFRDQEEQLAMRLLAWQYRKKGFPLPPAAQIRDQARRVVDQAHEIAKTRSRNVLSIIKELAGDLVGKGKS
ncbi:MAG: hypothetical protein KKA60_12620 [Proteobacteria bacterium]|nr:hypothetical protein [Pseudomonadota bacterium]